MNDEHVPTEAEKRLWSEGRGRGRSKPDDLSPSEKIKFLEILSRNSGSGEFEIKMGLSRRDVEYYKRQYNVEGFDDAKRLLRSIKTNVDSHEEIKRSKEARALAEKRLDEINRRKAAEDLESANRRLSNAPFEKERIANLNRERQRKFKSAGERVDFTDWRLPIESSNGEDEKNRFWNDISIRGMSFCRSKYGCSNEDIFSEAARLGLSVDWDMVRE